MFYKERPKMVRKLTYWVVGDAKVASRSIRTPSVPRSNWAGGSRRDRSNEGSHFKILRSERDKDREKASER